MPPLCGVRPSSRPCAVLICGTRWGLLLPAVRCHTRYMRGAWFLPFRLFARLDDLVFGMIGGGNPGGAGSNGGAGMGVRSTHSSSSSSRLAESEDIVCEEESTAFGLRLLLCRWLGRRRWALRARRVRCRCCPRFGRSQRLRVRRRSQELTMASPASKKSSDESSHSSSRVEPWPVSVSVGHQVSYYVTFTVFVDT